ncbi:MAG: L-rhamnose/proton symporter RhaT [Bacteroidota bacterium]|nr:L-rhamnose/proton symporter RhaT [Bacteroidota bacterium]MDP4194974.1 L-rhamnose/proton symporter RhaT [Bacteroidota bacterium]
MSSLSSILLIAMGSLCAASFYVPINKIKQWSWESYWVIQGVASWIIAPWIFAYFTVPNLMQVLSSSPSSAIINTMIFGALWGVGGLTFGLSMRFLGVAMGQSISLGFCAAFGTLAAPIISGSNLFSSHEGIMILSGVSICIAGIAVVGYAGAIRSKNLSQKERANAIKDFALKKGLLIAIFAGVMSACFSIGLTGISGVMDAGNKINDTAKIYGTDPLFASNPVYIIVMLGGFLTNFVYCMYLNYSNRTFSDYFSLPASTLINNLFFCFLGGTLWYLQFFFFGMGQSKLPFGMAAFGWSILMALNILFSNIWGIILSEWRGSGKRSVSTLVLGLFLLILSTFVIKL